MGRKRSSADETSAGPSKRANLECSQSLNLTQMTQALRSGKILRMRLINFMCHSNLAIDFNSRVNLLVGSNGSGKSAILTALIVGLGAKASKTNRSSSIKHLIKNGESSSTIEIELANNGADSYDHEKYGDKIIVIRHITGSASNYKLKNSSGQIVAKSRDELMKMLLYLNIQTDNPVFVLNQDSARTFLKDMEPSKNYQLFLKATQIETVLEKLTKCGHMYNNHKYHWQCCKKKSEVLKKEVSVLEEKYNRLLSAESIKKKLTEYKVELLWIQVKEQEDNVHQIVENMKKIAEQIKKLGNQISGKSSLEDEIKETIRSLQEEWDKKNSRINEENGILNVLRTAYNTANEHHQAEVRLCRKMADKLQHINEQIALLENHIEGRSEHTISQAKQMREKNEAKIETLKGQNNELQAIVDSAERDIKMLTNTIEQSEEEHHELNRRRKTAKTNISVAVGRLKEVEGTSANPLSVYGPHVEGLLAAIQKYHKAGKFSEMPRGPLGRYIEVPDKKWRGVIESLLGGLINAFLVNSASDRTVLEEIMKQYCPQAKHTIIISKFHKKVYDTRSGSVPEVSGAKLFMNEIICKDPVVMNCLIDRCGVETVLFVENQQLAIDLTSEQENVPQNLRRLILLDPPLEYLPAPQYRTYALNPRPPRYLQVSMGQIKIQLQNDIKQYKEQEAQLENRLRLIGEKLKELYVQQKRTNENVYKHKTSIKTNCDEIGELENVEYPNEDGLEVLKKELLEYQKTKNNLNAEKEAKEMNLNEASKDAIRKKVELEEQETKIQKIERDLESYQKQIDNKRLEMQTLQNKEAYWEGSLEKLKNELQSLKNDHDTNKARLHLVTDEAARSGARIDSNRSADELTELINNLQRKVREICSANENIEDIKSILDDKQIKYEKNEILVETIGGTLDLLKKSRIQRFKNLSNLKRHMALRVKFTFDAILKIKQYGGNIDIDHNEQKLNMSVVPRDNHINGAVSNTKSLSGGERSFSTVAFLLSLWACVDHPFYFLDEYDVFTDQVNREIMTKLLLNEAEKKPHRQYTFLSPQDMSFVQASSTIKIHKLAEPER